MAPDILVLIVVINLHLILNKFESKSRSALMLLERMASAEGLTLGLMNLS